MNVFGIRGGAKVSGRKELTAETPIETMPLPRLLHIPLQQHVGGPAVPVISVGSRVKKGQLIAASKGDISAPVHAPTSGYVTRIGDQLAPHPSGLPVLTLTLEPDGRDEWAELPEPLKLETATSKEIANRVSEAGVVGMGGAAFPSAVKLSMGERYELDSLILNGAECEPYLTCDDRLMRERADDTVIGIKFMMKALGVSKAYIAIEDNKPASIKSMQQACGEASGIEVVDVPARYPMGSSKHLVQAITGRETPASGRTADLGVVVNNVATAYAVYEACCLGRPSISRIVTLSGKAVRNPANYDALIGTPISELVKQSGGLIEEPQQLLMGGPMMGQPLPNLEVPIVKGSSGVLALRGTEIPEQNVMPCISCGSCVTVCPAGLLPMEMMNRLDHEDIDGADDIGLRDCISCGSCNYVCPSHIPLVQFFNYGKGKLKEQDIDKSRHERIKVLTEAREKRLEKQGAQ
jgi:electron transport complex protein RnfC